MRTGLFGESGERESLEEMVKSNRNKGIKEREYIYIYIYYFNERDNKIYYYNKIYYMILAFELQCTVIYGCAL